MTRPTQKTGTGRPALAAVPAKQAVSCGYHWMMSPSFRKNVKAYHHGNLRHALVQAALEQVELRGPESLSIKDLAKKLHVSQPAPYRHFSDRDELLVTAAQEAFRQFNRIFMKASEDAIGRSKLSCVVRAALIFGLHRPGIYRLMFGSRTAPSTGESRQLRDSAAETFKIISESLECLAGEPRQERTTFVIWAIVHGTVMLAEEGLLIGKMTKRSMQKIIEDTIEDIEFVLFRAPQV